MLTFTGTSTAGTTAQIRNIPYGKYRIDVRVSDTVNNQTTHSRVFYVDSLNMTISSDTYDIGDIALSPPPLEQIITVQSVGASFQLRVNGDILIHTNDDPLAIENIIEPLSGGSGW